MDREENQINSIEGYQLWDKEFFEMAQRFEKVKTMYDSVIKEVQTKFDILNSDLSVSYNRNPIQFVKTRIKKLDSIMKKLEKRGLDLTIDTAVENLADIAGVRVICSFIDDIYEVAEMFTKQDDITLLEVKDYIKNPKENGYRSYHMIVETPVFFADSKKMVRVEVQFRTIAMDFWASLEHQMKYKKDYKNSDEIIRELKECAEAISTTDIRMQEINKMINAGGLE